ncbi:tubulin-specific chaperone E [Amylocarpus encephaloides]|uniref:Tubulin-specific chaperone E n=1 Tax=Amylocarpus encephaloides TaxID=45428 RepID=A0A9P8C5D3_9HELO|nr:tubulin-specific chaperone E [Amylocarpus encephaloides]
MPHNYHVGQRVSFSNSSGTIRYIGLVEGFVKEERLGIEWDNPNRGKHDGQFKGKRYFACLSGSATGGSFLRISAIKDPDQSFVEAVYQKYAPPEPEVQPSEHVISGKVAEEIGFDKIRKQQAQLHKLTIVLVDGFRINSAESEDHTIRETCPRIVELDLSRNTLEDFEVVVQICGELDNLNSLRLNNNKFSRYKNGLQIRKEFDSINQLELKEMYVPFSEIVRIASEFSSLRELDASINAFTSIPCPLKMDELTSLTLEFNKFTSLTQLSQLASLGALQTLKLKGNQIYKIITTAVVNAESASTKLKTAPTFSKTVKFVDLSHNKIDSWDFIDGLADVFPGLTALRLSENPIHKRTAEKQLPATIDDPSMVTIARLSALKTLDYREISPEYRTDAEGFYLSLIGKAIAEAPESEESKVVAKHKRYEELCIMYGTPAIPRVSIDTINPNFLEARLINFEFYVKSRNSDTSATIHRKIPRSFDVYRVKGILGALLNYHPLKLKLTWETGIWDPVAGYEEDQFSDIEEDSPKGYPSEPSLNERGKWMKREEEIPDTLKMIGHCVDGSTVRIRVELMI